MKIVIATLAALFSKVIALDGSNPSGHADCASWDYANLESTYGFDGSNSAAIKYSRGVDPNPDDIEGFYEGLWIDLYTTPIDDCDNCAVRF